MSLAKLKVIAGLLLAAGMLAASGGRFSQSLKVAAQAPAGAKKDFPPLDELAKLAAVIKPTPDENKWQQVPWISDINEALRQAKAEKRPVLLWTILGEPLDEC